MLLEALLAVALANSWETHGPAPGTSAVAVAAGDGRRVYAAAGSIFRSEDGGETWRRLFDPPNADYFTGLFADPSNANRVFASSLHAGFAYFTTRLYRSVDGGETWTNPVLILGATSCSVAISGATVYVSFGGSEPSFLRSDDGGASFFGLAVPFAGANLAIDHDGSLLAVTAGSVLRSRDGGSTWNAAFETPVPCEVESVVVGGGNHYALCGEVLRSMDGGVTWSRASDVGGPALDLVMDQSNPSLIFVSTAPVGDSPGRVLVSDDDGDSWEDLELPVTAGANDLAITEDGDRLYAATPDGAYSRSLRRTRVIPPRP